MKRTKLFNLLIFSLLAAVNSPAIHANNNTVFGKIQEWEVTALDIEKEAGDALQDPSQSLYDVQITTTKRLLSKKALELESRRRNVSKEDLLSKALQKRMKKVTKKQVIAFIQEHGTMENNLKDKEAFVTQVLTDMNTQDALQSYYEYLLSKYNAQIYIDPLPKSLISDTISTNGFSKGNQHAPITIVEYIDYQNSRSISIQPYVEELLHKYKGRIRLEYKPFPLIPESPGWLAAEASYCAAEQNKFWLFNDLILDHQGQFSGYDIPGMAPLIGLNEKKFIACLESSKHKSSVRSAVREGRLAGVRTAPTFIINGKISTNLPGSNEIERMINGIPPS